MDYFENPNLDPNSKSDPGSLELDLLDFGLRSATTHREALRELLPPPTAAPRVLDDSAQRSSGAGPGWTGGGTQLEVLCSGVHKYAPLHTCVCGQIQIYIVYIYIYVCIHTHTFVYVYIYIYVYTYTYIYTRMHIQVCVSTYISCIHRYTFI